MSTKKIIVPLPRYGFDPSEAAIPWQVLSSKNVEVIFATPDGRKANADTRMLTGEGLGVWKPMLRARKDAIAAYGEMGQSPSFSHPLKYDGLTESGYDGILLPGGHDKGVREYLESKVLQKLVADFFLRKKPVAAICHGVVLVARSIDPGTAKSVIRDYQTTSLLRSQEMAAYNLTRLWLGDYYLTYPGLAVQDEVTSVLSNKLNFKEGPVPLQRDGMEHLERGFIVLDRHYLSARWPGDAYSFSLALLKLLGC